jgi:ATP-binding cassette subfamily B (MDR/TAP) protein 1
LLGAIKPASDVTQDEIYKACRNANILDFIQSLPELVTLVTVIAGKH